MKKKIVVSVDKLILKHNNPKRDQKKKVPVHRHLNFSDLFHLAKNNQSNAKPDSQFLSLNNSLGDIKQASKNSHRKLSTDKNIRNIRHSLQNVAQSKRKNQIIGRSGSLQRIKKQQKHKNPSQNSLLNEICPQVHSSIRYHSNLPSEYRSILATLNHTLHEHLRQTECFLSQIELHHILTHLHFVKRETDLKFVKQMWEQLQGEEYGGVPCMNLLEFLKIIEEEDKDIYIEDHIQDNLSNVSKGIKIDKNLKIIISKEQRKLIYDNYFALRINRILYEQGLTENGSKSASFEDRVVSQKMFRSVPLKATNKNNIKIVDQLEESPQKQNYISFSKNAYRKSSQNKENIQPFKKSIKLKTSNDSRKKNESKSQESAQTSPFLKSSSSCLQNQNGKSKDNLHCSEYSASKSNSSHSKTPTPSIQTETSPKPSFDPIEQILIKKPILSVDVNLGEGLNEKLIVYEGQTANDVSRRLVDKYHIDQNLRCKFESMLQSHIRNLLWKIEEVSQEMFSDRDEM